MRTKNNHISRFFALAALCLFFTQHLSAQNSGSRPTTQQIIAGVDKYVNAAVKNIHFSGAVLIARDGRPIVSKGYGMANYELNVPNTPQTVFRIASVTKQFTAMGVMILQERGKLKINDSICKYLEDCPAAWRPITVRNLLTQTSGLFNFVQTDDFWNKSSAQPYTPAELVKLFHDKPLEFTPGEKFVYSNSNYCLLGVIIEKVSGMPYAEYLRHNIFTPLKMNNTGYDDSIALVKNRANGYKWTGKVPENAFHMNMTAAFAAGGLYSTTEDLLLWDQALYTAKLVSSKTLNEIFTPFKGEAFKPGYKYAYGWAVGKMFDRQAEEHSGQVHGFSADIIRFPAERVTIIFLSNTEYGGPEIMKIGDDLSALAFGEAR